MNISWEYKEPCHTEAKHGDLGKMTICVVCGEEYLKKIEETKKEEK